MSFGDGKHRLTLWYDQHGVRSTDFMIQTSTGSASSVSWVWIPSRKHGFYRYEDGSAEEGGDFLTIVEEDYSLRQPCPATAPHCGLTSAVMAQLREIKVDWKAQSRLGFGQLSYWWDDFRSLQKEPDREFLEPRTARMRELLAGYTRMVDQHSTETEVRSAVPKRTTGGGTFQN